MEGKYKFLQFSHIVFKVLSWLILGIGIVLGIVILIGGGTPNAPRIISLVSLVLGIIYWFILLTISEIIKVLLDLGSDPTTLKLRRASLEN